MEDYKQIFQGNDGFGQIVRRWVNLQMKKKFNKDISVDDFLWGTNMNNLYRISLHKENSMLEDDEYSYTETLVKLLNDGEISVENMISDLEENE